MSSIVIAGDTSGTCTLQAANVAGNTVLNLPTTSGTLVSSGSIPAAGSTTQVQYNNAGAFAGSSSFVFDGTNVGIGTSSPTAPLTVVTPSGGLALQINGRSSDNLGGLYFYANNGTTSYSQITASATEYRVASQSTAVQTFYTNGTERMRISSTGNVGIGTASPDRPLVVTSSSDAMTISQTGGGVGLQMSQSSVNDVLLRMTNSSGHYWDIRNQGSGSQFLIGGFFGDTLRLGTTGDLQFNSGYGSVTTAYGVRAWVNFNGSSGSINGSGGVSSVTRNGTGDYTVAYSFTFPSNTYTLWGMGRRNSSAQRPVLLCMNNSFYENTTTGARFYTMLNDSATIEDPIQFWFGAIR